MSCPAHEIAAVKGTMSSGEVDNLIGIARGLPAGNVLVYDLGSGVGTTALCVMQGRQSAIEIVSIDNREQEIYWAGVAMKNIGREADWHGISGDVLDKGLIPTRPIDLLIIDVDDVNVDDIFKLWRPAMSLNGVVWFSGKLMDVNLANEEETKTEEVNSEEAEVEETEIEKASSEERPPCEKCGYVPPEEKSYVHAMRAHKRSHKSDES